MKLPESLAQKTQWSVLGPMGPELPPSLRSHPVMGIDGGAKFSNHLDVWIGDGDSHQSSVSSDNSYRYDSKKSQSDLALALTFFSLPGNYTLHLWGFLGGRKDHELFNLGECLRFLESKKSSEIIFYSNRGEVSFHLYSSGSWGFSHQGEFSVGCLKETRLQILGDCEYLLPISTTMLPLSSLGLSNYASGEVKLISRDPIFVYFQGAK